MFYNFRPLVGFSERAREVEDELADNPRALAIYQLTIETIEPDVIAALQRKYGDELADFNPSGPFKYADIPHWIGDKARFAVRLDLDKRGPSTILDIGTGCAHLLAIANALGHRSIGIDVDFPFYSDVCTALGVDRRTVRVAARQQLPQFSVRFDIVTAMAIVFNRSIASQGDLYWSDEDWEFFINDVRENQLNETGLFLLGINGKTPEVNKRFFSELKQKGAGGERDIYALGAPVVAAAAPQLVAPKTAHPAGTSSMLIFETTRVPIQRLYHPAASIKYMKQAREAETSPARLRGTFPIPGRRSLADFNTIRFEADAIEFPSAGEYYFYCDYGAFKILILDHNESKFDHAKQIFSFVGKNIVHSRADLWMCMPEGFTGPFQWNRLVEKFFYSDQPLQLMCGHSIHFLACVLHARGIDCRIAWIHQEAGAGHIVLEAWNAESCQWVMFDSDWGLCVADKEGRLLSAAEIVGCLASATSTDHVPPEQLNLINAAGKCWNRQDFSYPPLFTGHISWNPSCQSPQDPAQPGVYFGALSACVGTITYEAYDFDDTRGTAHWKSWRE